MDEIEIVGHHLLNLFACFLGKNRKKKIDKLIDITREDLEKYGEDFIENAENILKEISRDPIRIKIRLVTTADDFCKKCRQLDKCNWDRIGAEEIDGEVIKAIGCEVNAVYSFDELLKKGKEFIQFQENQTFIFRSWIGQKLLYQIKSFGG